MTSWTGAAYSHLLAQKPFRVRHAFHFRPRTWDTQTRTSIRLWTGDENRDFDFEGDGTPATYTAVGPNIEIEPITYGVGTVVRYLGLSVGLTAAGETFVRGYDTHRAPAWHWEVLYSLETNAFLGYRRMWKGTIEEVTISTAEEDGASFAQVRLATTGRIGTLNPAGKKSDESQKRRFAGDRGRRYGDLGTVNNAKWGVSD